MLAKRNLNKTTLTDVAIELPQRRNDQIVFDSRSIQLTVVPILLRTVRVLSIATSEAMNSVALPGNRHVLSLAANSDLDSGAIELHSNQSGFRHDCPNSHDGTTRNQG